MKKFRSPYDYGLEMKMPYEDSMTTCFLMRGTQTMLLWNFIEFKLMLVLLVVEKVSHIPSF